MWTTETSRRSLRLLVRHGRPHWKRLATGGIATVGVVLLRLAMPWPIRGVMEVAFSGNGEPVVGRLPEWGEPMLWLGLAYLVLAGGVGLSEALQRVRLMQFAAETVHDMRAAAVVSAAHRGGPGNSGDMVARIVGDSARIKAGLSSILVHALRNGLYCAGACIVLLFLSLPLALFFVLAALGALAVGMRATVSVAASARKQRQKEGKYAELVQASLEAGGLQLPLEKLDRKSARKDVKTTRLVAASSFHAHMVVALCVSVALWLGVVEARAGSLEPGELFLFVAYTWTMHRRMVQVGRQAARTGKVLACVERMEALVGGQRDDGGEEGAAREAAGEAVKELVDELRLENVRLPSARGKRGKRRLQVESLSIPAGSRVAVLGKAGAGKSALLRILAGREPLREGRVVWDGRELSAHSAGLQSAVGYLPQRPGFPPRPVWELLGLPGPGALQPSQAATLEQIGALRVLRSLPRGLEEKVGSAALSEGESRALALGALLLKGPYPLLVLDGPLEGLVRRRAQRRLAAIQSCVAGTLVVALGAPVGLGQFNRLIALRRGRISFDGPPGAWRRKEDVPCKR